MKNITKKILIIFMIIILLFIIVIIFLKINNDKISKTENKENSTPTDNIQYNQNEELIKEQKVNGITFSNIKCSFDGSISLLEYTITNQTNETIHLEEYEMIVKDQKGNILANLAPNLNIELKPNESYESGSAIDIDLSNAYSMEFVINE